MNKISKTLMMSLGVFVAAFIVALLVTRADVLLGLANYKSTWSLAGGVVILLIGLFFRLWASYTFYSNDLKVLALKPQSKIVQSGPYRYTRNPLYVGIILILLGWTLILGSKAGLVAVVLSVILFHLDLTLSGEKELENKFGEEYRQYKLKVPRWF
ncbi:MAG TPA: isoprenylcysteine carboxylmethyltransferase family protein [Candidatus Paceibacterota bacterium]